MSDNRSIGYAVFGFGFGIWSFFWGFKRLRRKRLIENIPTSTVRGMAMGLVELIGKAGEIKPLVSPLTKTKCVLYQYLIEEYRSSGRSGRWVKIASGDSFYCPFWLDDGTGRVIVFPKGAEMILPLDYEFKTGFGKTLPSNLTEFMDNSNIAYKSLFGIRTLRFQEWFIREGETVYVLGTAGKTEDPVGEHKGQLMQRIEELKQNQEKIKEADLNKDGEISEEEWGLAVAKIENELLQETLKTTPIENTMDVVITKGDAEKIFMVSDCSQKELIKKLSWQCMLGIYGGVVLSLVLLAYILFYLAVFRY